MFVISYVTVEGKGDTPKEINEYIPNIKELCKLIDDLGGYAEIETNVKENTNGDKYCEIKLIV